MSEIQPQALYLKDYRAPEFLINQTHLCFELKSGYTLVSVKLEIERNQGTPESCSLKLDGDDLDLISIKLDGNELSESEYVLTSTGLEIKTNLDTFSLSTQVRIYPDKNTALEGLYRSGGMYCTQCEAEGFRRITYYLDRPDVMSVFTTEIIADAAEYPVLLSNGNCQLKENLGDGLQRVVWHDPHKKPAYLFALVAGKLEVKTDTFRTMSNKQVALEIYVEPQNIDKTDYALDALKRAMRWDEEVYGREYDLDVFMIVAVDDFNMGAMENKGLNVFNSSCVLANPKTATDQTYLRIEAIVAHEYFHNWSGNRVTCRDWFQLSLKEGFTVFRDACFSADMNSPTVKRIEDVRLLRTAQFAEDAGPTAHPVQPDSYMEISNFYTLTIYEKGAELVRMLYHILGAEDFYKGSDLYFERHDGQAVSIHEFIDAMQTVSNQDLTQFKIWYKQAGTPVVSVHSNYDKEQQRLTLTLKQHTPDTPEQTNKQPVPIPVTLGLLDAQGDEYALNCEQSEAFNAQSSTLIFSEQEQSFSFTGLKEAPVVSLFRGFSAPVKIEFEQTQDELLTLMMHDGDGFNRWDASQRLLLNNLNQALGDKTTPLNPNWIKAAQQILDSQSLDDTLKTYLLSLPSQAYLLENIEKPDPQAVAEAHQSLNKQLANALSPQCEAIYRAYQMPESYAAIPEQIGARTLKNWALSVWANADEKGVQAAVEQCKNANNMTCEMAVLNTLISYGNEQQTKQALQNFYTKFQQDSLVLNQWFSAQSSNAHYINMDKLDALLNNPSFDWKNPNKVRAVVGGFCQSALSVFHHKDGKGYEFLADAIIKLDAINPQIAARLVAPLSKWQRMAEPYAALMHAQLKRIAATNTLSKDVYELVSKSLQEKIS